MGDTEFESQPAVEIPVEVESTRAATDRTRDWRSEVLVRRLVRLHNLFIFATVVVALVALGVGRLLPWNLAWPVRAGLDIVRFLMLIGALAWTGMQTHRRIQPLIRAESLPLGRAVVAYGRTKRGSIRSLAGVAIFSGACLLVSRGLLGHGLAVLPFLALVVTRPSVPGLAQFCAFILYKRQGSTESGAVPPT